MGDKEFEDFLEGREGGEQVIPCQKRLLFDMIQQKMDASIDLIGVLSKLDSKEKYIKFIDSLVTMSKESFDQLEYLISVVLDEINGESEGKSL